MEKVGAECHSVRKRKATISRIDHHYSGAAGSCYSLKTVTVQILVVAESEFSHYRDAEQNPHAIMTRNLSMASMGKVLCTRRFFAILAVGGTPCITLILGATIP